jgi:two-component system chemotaxis response regulator CheB
VVGVVLSGLLGDGTAGLAAIASQGGVTMVQDPTEAEYADMPRSALRHVPVRHCLPVAGIATLLSRLCGTGQPGTGPAEPTLQPGKEADPMGGGYTLKRPAELTCPSCGGTVRQTQIDSLTYFECHIGHRFAAQDMDEAQFQELEMALEVALRVLNERGELCRRLAEAARARNQPLSAERWEAALREAHDRAGVLRRFIEQGWERPLDDGDEGSAPPLAAS